MAFAVLLALALALGFALEDALGLAVAFEVTEGLADALGEGEAAYATLFKSAIIERVRKSFFILDPI